MVLSTSSLRNCPESLHNAGFSKLPFTSLPAAEIMLLSSVVNLKRLENIFKIKQASSRCNDREDRRVQQ